MPDIFVSDSKSSPKSEEPRKPADPKDEDPAPSDILKKKVRTSKHRLKGHSHNPLAAFCYFPDKVNFETKERQEKVVLLLRRHPITNVPWILMFVAMLLAPLVLQYFPILAFFPANFQAVAILGWYIVAVAFALEGFLTWFFNVNIITDERVVDIDFHNLIYKEVSDTKIDNVQDVTYKMGGVVRTIFNFGDVHIQTAAQSPEFDFLAVPKPDRVARVLQDLIIEEEKEKVEGRVR